VISIAAAISVGGQFPCDEGRAPLGNVIILAAEDGAADTTIPRLLAAGAELKHVHLVRAVRTSQGDQTFSLQTDLDLLEAKIRSVGNVALVCVDPISSYIGRKVDSRHNTELRMVLEPFGLMAERTRVGLLSLTHFNKPNGNASAKAIHRFMDSIAFVAAARAAFIAIEDPDDEDRCLFLQAKNNIAKSQRGLAYRKVQTLVGDAADIVAPYVVWDSEPVAMTADQAVGNSGGRDPTHTEDAVEFLQTVLTDGPVAISKVEAEAREAGYLRSDQSLAQSKPFRAARTALGIKTRKDGMAGGWVLSLPKTPSGEDALNK
jgi:putative DNA primase/helicase